MQRVTTSTSSQSPWVAGKINFDYTSHETQLISKARRGDLSAFNRLVYTYQERAFRFAYRVLGDSDAAGQSTQQAFVLARRHFNDFRDDSLSVWLLRFVTRACREQLHARRPPRSSRPATRSTQSTDDTRGAGSSGSTSRAIGAEQTLEEILQQGLATLTFELRAILVLADMEAYSCEQISAITGTRADAVQSRLASARLELARFLAAHADRLPIQYRQNAVKQ